MKKRILVISHDKVGIKMAGPGIRYHHIATELSKQFEVSLGVFNPKYIEDIKEVDYEVINIKSYDFYGVFKKHDVIIALWLSSEMVSFAKRNGIRIIFDLYAPVPVENIVGLMQSKKTNHDDDYDYAVSLDSYADFMRSGDFFLCSNPIQRDFWIGYFFASFGALPSNINDFDPFKRFGLVPMGIDPKENIPIDKNIFVEDYPQINKNDFILIWTGGVWNWFDGTTPIKAIDHLVNTNNSDIKLIFLGTKHPNYEVPEMSELTKTYEEAKKRGLLNKNVFFKEGWIDYSERAKYLKSASVAVYSHKPSIEAQYSHRTRVLDHILFEIPTIATRGDYLGNYLEDNGMGLTVTPERHIELAEAILKLKTNPKIMNKMVGSIAKNKNKFYWETTLKPLINFIESDGEARKEFTVPKVVSLSKSRKRMLLKYLPKPIKKTAKKILRK